MQPVWVCFLSGKPFEDTFENTQWIKVKQMQPVWLCILSGNPFDDSFENTQWRKVEQMQPVWLCIFPNRRFEDSFENKQWEVSNKSSQCDYASSQTGSFWTHLKTHSGEKSNKCNQWERIWIWIWVHIWKHIMEKSQISATSVTLHIL